ncbi:guanine deaminase [Uliginosibacterium sp. TH139]|uniref:guanine deaminase n=1 Tax=Uliginosibacterium sp. TH139 TaxID=2067453 RepID=UPI000C795ACB|nr:guanine deaminase [Uliginosibacterium sp. TH139]PLK49978.1 guanine deaminase [Uliginosibacterium sp. TH139]
MNPLPTAILVRGSILHFLADPGPADDSSAWQYFEDGGLLVEDGLVLACGPWGSVLDGVPQHISDAARYFDYRGQLIVPGFVDTHTHYPQLCVMGSWGRKLLDWLEDYTFPAEMALADEALAQRTASFFVERLLAHGTTTASVFATVHAHSVDAFFSAAARRNLRMLCGKVMMDRNCPPALRDTPASALDDGMALIERWHGQGRLGYSVTPRFAPTSSPEQLAVASELWHSRPGLHLQSHLSENPQELAWVAELFPGRRDYLDVYEHYGLLGPRAIYGHGIHLSASERTRLAASGTAIAFCPGSNLFLGSGFCPQGELSASGVRLGLATDVGGCASLSMLQSMASAYEVSQAAGQVLSPWRAWYLATLGGALALGLDAQIGSFQRGREADFVVLDSAATPELAWRLEGVEALGERLFALMMMGDERCVRATHILGERAFCRSEPQAVPAVR